MSKNQYVDLDLNFNIHPVRGDVSKLTDENAVKAAVKHLVLTKFFERPFQPNTGCGVHSLLFDPMGPATTIAIEKVIREVILNFESRVDLRKVDVVPNERENRYDITIIFTVLDKETPIQLNVILRRIR